MLSRAYFAQATTSQTFLAERTVPNNDEHWKNHQCSIGIGTTKALVLGYQSCQPASKVSGSHGKATLSLKKAKTDVCFQTMNADSLDFGFMYDSKTMMCMHEVKSAPSIKIQFRQNMFRREIAIQTQIYIQDGRAGLEDGRHIPKFGKYNRTETYQFRVPFSQLQTIHQIRTEGHQKVLLISLETPPRFFRKVPEMDTHEEHARFWTQNDAWYRQTDIVYNPNHIGLSPLTLKKSKAVIDIGIISYLAPAYLRSNS